MPYDSALQEEPKYGLYRSLPPAPWTLTSLTETRAESVRAYANVERPRSARTTKLVPLVEWEGVVERIDLDQQCFTAKLVDQRSPSVEIEYADFSFDQVDLDDRDLLRSGGVFRWVIGKRTNEFGRVENTSRLIFRRLPGYSKREIELADERASRWADALGAVAFFD